jgi:hypothetical protein
MGMPIIPTNALILHHFERTFRQHRFTYSTDVGIFQISSAQMNMSFELNTLFVQDKGIHAIRGPTRACTADPLESGRFSNLGKVCIMAAFTIRCPAGV